MRKRSLLAALLTGLAGVASAQSDVTLYGVLDNNLGWGSGSISSNKSVGTGGLAGSRLGFRGSEDLGSGLRAKFLIEHGFNSNDGTPASPTTFWNRQVYVGLSNVATWGEVDVGRQYTPTFLVHATYDAFGPQGVASQQVLFGSMELAQPANLRANGAINYQSPNSGGFGVQAMTSDGTPAPGKYSGLRLGYNNGSVLSADLAFGQYDNAPIGDLHSLTLGARLIFGSLKVYGLYDRANSGKGPDSHGIQVSAAYTVGVTDLKASIAQSSLKSPAGADIGTTRRYGVGFVHFLSKRTQLYGSLATLQNSDGAKMTVNKGVTAPNEPAKGMDLGICHWF